MTLTDLAGRLNVLQRTFRFKVVASVVVAALAIGGYSAWLIYLNAPERLASEQAAAQPQPTGAPTAEQRDGAGGAAPAKSIDRPVTTDDLRRVLGSRSAAYGVAVGVFGGAGLAILVIWLGLGLTYLGLMIVGSIVAIPLTLFPPTRGLGQMLLGVVALTAGFTALMQGARLLLSADLPSIAIARNVLAEAVRMRVSVVFIVMLILLLAALPGALNADQPLRYRVQSFLQYSVSGTFWVLALMTLFFAAGTVAFEQRDKVIWQTMSKPVSPRQYLFGKWLGVITLNAVLLTVSASGVFLFTEHLRGLPAQGEERPFVNADGTSAPTTDRLLLHTQVLVARAGVEPAFDSMPREELLRRVGEARKAAVDRDPSLAQDKDALTAFENNIAQEQLKAWDQEQRTISPGHYRSYVFRGLSTPRERGLPLTLRYNIVSGGNNPSDLYRVTFRIAGDVVQRQVVLNSPQVIPFHSEAIDPEGRVTVEVYNGDPATGEVNMWSIQFPPDGLEILYVAGGYESNFARVMVVNWAKLAFIAAVAIGAATFLSFPVACLLAMLVLFAAETAGFLNQSLDYYQFHDNEGKLDLFSSAIRIGALPVAWAFRSYADLNPTANLVDGRLVPWTGVGRAVLMLGVWSMIAMGAGWAIFRKRELATYSGH